MITKRIRFLLVLAFIILVLSTSCSKNNSLSENQNTPDIISSTPTLSSSAPDAGNINNNYEQLDDKTASAKSIDDVKSWIESTTPADNATAVDYSSSIGIQFKQDMEEKSLNENNIIIEEAKHSSIM